MKRKNEKAKSKNVTSDKEAMEPKKVKEVEENENVVSFKTMTNNEMLDLFVSLQKTSYWQAILRSIADRDAILLGSLALLDPFKEPTKVARTQGERTGLYYIEMEVNKLIKEVEGTE